MTDGEDDAHHIDVMQDMDRQTTASAAKTDF